MYYESSQTEAVIPVTKARAPIDVAQREWPTHPLLKRASVNSSGDALEWPGSTKEQLVTLRDISLWIYEGEFFARLDSEINLDFFVDGSTDEGAPAHSPFHQPDRQRYYARFTRGGFHLVGGYSAVTLEGRRRYFQLLAGGWVGVGLGGFLSVRDDSETQFSEVTLSDFEQLFSAATEVTGGLPTGEEQQASRHRRESHPVGPTEFDASAKVDPLAPAENPSQNSELSDTPAQGIPKSVDVAWHPEESSTAPVVPQGAIQRSIAIALATVALRGCTDRMGAALIDHAARVSESFDVVNNNVRHCASWLHDVLECSDLTDKDLRDAGLVTEIVDVVRLLTHDSELTEGEWLSAISSHPDARAVKLAAIADNASPWRLRHLDEGTRSEILNTLIRWREGLSADSAG